MSFAVEMRALTDRLFPGSPGGRSLGREVAGGATTFAALSYILFVQPTVLSQAGMDFQSVMLATCLVGAFATFLMGLLANYPIALSPGMGENFFFVYTLCAAPPLGFGLSWQQALAATFLSGVLFMVLAALGYLGRLVNVIPKSLKTAIAAGIGLFITLIGLEYGNLVQAHPATLVQLGDLGHPTSLLTLFGLLLTGTLLAYRVAGAIDGRGVLQRIPVIGAREESENTPARRIGKHGSHEVLADYRALVVDQEKEERLVFHYGSAQTDAVLIAVLKVAFHAIEIV